jgi:hypothetical protein
LKSSQNNLEFGIDRENLEKFFTENKLAEPDGEKWTREFLTQYFYFITAFEDQGKANAACRQLGMFYLGEVTVVMKCLIAFAKRLA